MMEDRRRNTPAIPLTDAVLCPTCDVVWSWRLSRRCPLCDFTLHVSLAVVLNRRRPTLVRS